MKKLFVMLSILVLPLATVAADQNDPDLERLFSVLQQDLNVYEAAAVNKQIWETWLHTDDEEAKALLDKGNNQMNQGRVDAAIRTFSELVDVAPKFAEAWNRRATAYYMAGEFGKSISDVYKVLELEPRHYGAMSGLGLIYEQLEETDSAIKAFREALDVNPHMDRIRTRLERLEDLKADDL